MATQTIDLKDLLTMIKKQKDIDANWGLDLGCIIETEDIKPLVKVINYILNYLSQLSNESIQITLTLQKKHINMSFFSSTEHTELPEVSDSIEEAVIPYHASLKMEHEPGKYVQFLIVFNKDEEEAMTP